MGQLALLCPARLGPSVKARAPCLRIGLGLALQALKLSVRASSEEMEELGDWTSKGLYLFWPDLSLSRGSGSLPTVRVTLGVRYLNRTLRSLL